MPARAPGVVVACLFGRRFARAFRADREQNFSIVDEELERGLRALAVPVLDRSGQVIGAINLSTHSTRTTRNEMREQFLPELNRIAEQVASMTV